jgi:hypothetical protein
VKTVGQMQRGRIWRREEAQTINTGEVVKKKARGG